MRLQLLSAVLAAAIAGLAGAAHADIQATEKTSSEDLRCVFVALSGGDAKGSEAGTARRALTSAVPMSARRSSR